MSSLNYQIGFGNAFATEALPGALPLGRNSPQRCPYGLYAEQLRRWRTSCEQANAQSQSAARQEADALKAERRRTRDLERELRRKNAALAETAALLTLRKKARAIWGDEEE